MNGRFGDLACGNGYLGEIVDLPPGMVGLALFNEHGWERRIVYVPAEQTRIVRLERERPRSEDQRSAELRRATEDYTREHQREGWGW